MTSSCEGGLTPPEVRDVSPSGHETLADHWWEEDILGRKQELPWGGQLRKMEKSGRMVSVCASRKIPMMSLDSSSRQTLECRGKVVGSP